MQAQQVWVLNTSSSRLPGDPRRPKLPSPRRIARHVALAMWTARLVRRERVQVVHLHGSTHDLSIFGNALPIVAAAAAGARTLWHLHEDLGVVSFPGRVRATQLMFSTLMRLPDRVALLSERDRVVAARFVDERRTLVLPPTCDPEFTTLPIERAVEDDVLRIVYVGWLTAAKGIYDLLDVAAILHKAHVRCMFWVLGIGMTEAETMRVRDAVAQRHLDTVVRLCGLVTGEAKRAMFASAHVLFLPTHWDAFPVTVLEGLAAGLPIVSTRVGGLPYLVHNGQGGFLLEPGDVEGMSERLAHLSELPRERLEMGAYNRTRFLQAYHPDIVAQRALEVYQELGVKRLAHVS
jgi:glycosyltransferase involved in cell wall biosynthesis